MTSPKFTTLPLEIRNRIYDYVWDLGQAMNVEPKEPPIQLRGDRRPPRSRRLCPFQNMLHNTILALLFVSHQISAEAALTFYGKRTFRFSDPRLLGSFLMATPLHRQLIRDVSFHYLWAIHPAWELLRAWSSLLSFTLYIYNDPSCRRPEQLDIHHLNDLMKCTLIFWQVTTTSRVKDGKVTDNIDRVRFTNAWTCAKGETEWRVRGVHCALTNDIYKDHMFQACDHDHHRLARQSFAGA